MPRTSKYITLWSHFKLSANGTSAMCVHCNKTIQLSHTSIGNLIRHLRVKHPKQYAILLNDSHIDTSTTTTTVTSSLQTKERSEVFSNELVRAVEKRPELYRGGHTSTERLKHWKEIASELGESVTYCQEEWRCLKKLFQSHVREGNGPDDTNEDMDQQMELMKFLVPYVNQESDESEAEEEGEELAAQDDEQFEDPLDNKFVVFENVGPSKPTASSPIISRKRKMDTVPDDSSKKLFLLSLMPDVRLMDNTQMRRFKRKVLELIDDILNDDA